MGWLSTLFLRQLLAPFVAIALLVAAHYVARAIVPLMPEGRVKRFLTKRRSTRSELMERADAHLFAFLRRLLRRPRRKQA